VYVIIRLSCYSTTIKEHLLPTIPMKVFKFKFIKDIADGNFVADLLLVSL